MRKLKREAARQGRTIAEMMEVAIHMLLRDEDAKRELPPLPEFAAGRPQVNVANREALYDVMESD